VSISLRSSVRRASTALTVTLNCAPGGSFPVDPQANDIIMAIVYYTDDSGLPGFAGAAGWAQLFNNTFVSATTVFQIWERLVTPPEATYTWTGMSNGQSGQVFELHAFCLPGAFTGGYNPGGADPLPFRNLNQAGALTQHAPNATMAAATSALMAGWAYDSNAQSYTGLGTLGGVTPTAIIGSGIAGGSGSSLACISGLWLAPGVGTFTPTASSAGTLGRWGSVKWGIRQQPPAPAVPTTPALYGASTGFAPRRRRVLWTP
jgi:hypothetical protein